MIPDAKYLQWFENDGVNLKCKICSAILMLRPDANNYIMANHMKFKHAILFRKMMADVMKAKAREYDNNDKTET